MKIRDRIRELRRVRAADLVPNPKNWRTHPEGQADALRGVLSEIGYATALIARELPDGSLMLIDGHLRAETTPDHEVPVLVLDVDEAEADLLLATLDPLAALAESNAAILEELLSGVQSGNEAVQSMLADLAEAEGVTPKDDAADTEVVPKTGWEIVVTCTNEEQQRQIFDQLTAEGVECRVLTY